MILRLKPVLIGFEIDGYFELPMTRCQNESDIAKLPICVTLCNSNNELVWSSVQFARESLQTLGWTRERFGILCHDPNHICPTVETQP